MSPDSMQAVFEAKYAHEQWPGGLADGTRSGFGSTLASTEQIRPFLARLVREHEIRSMLDAPCGDFHWMREVELPADFRYLGGDIAAPLIAELRATASSEGVDFFYFDICTTPFPDVDLWLCRDCFIHLPLGRCLEALHNFAVSDVSHALLTTYDDVDDNVDIPVGRFSRRNMQRPPFDLPAPIESVVDGRRRTRDPDRRLGLWSREQIRVALRASGGPTAR